MPAPYRTFRRLREYIAPRFLTEGEGGLVGYTLDLMRDALIERVRLGQLARFPQNGPNGETAPEDALAALGRDRRVWRGINETDAAYAVRLKQWLVDRRTAGNPFTLMRQLAAYTQSETTGTSFRTVDVRGNFYSRSSSGVETSSLDTGLWDWDGDTASWSRFWVIIYGGTLWADSGQRWGTAGTWGAATSTWGSTALTEEQSATLRAIVADWKPAGTRCQNIIIALDPASFDPSAPEPDGLWDKPYKYVGGVAVSTRLATALYLDGTSS